MSDCSYPLLPSFSAGVVFLGEVPQVVIIVKIKDFHQILKGRSRRNGSIISKTEHQRELRMLMVLKGMLRFLYWSLRTFLTSRTVQNWIPLTEFPSLSSGGDQHIIPITLGTTNRIPPDTPDLAGRPTYSQGRNESKNNTNGKINQEELIWK